MARLELLATLSGASGRAAGAARTVRGHRADLTCVLLPRGAGGGRRCVWGAAAAGHTDRVWSLAWNHNGTVLASCSGDKTISAHRSQRWAGGARTNRIRARSPGGRLNCSV